jgi:phospholipid N-methyltransferase
VVLVRTDVSEERIAFIITVKIISELRAVVPSSPILATPMMEPIRFSETSVLIRATLRHIPEDGILQNHRRENLKS